MSNATKTKKKAGPSRSGKNTKQQPPKNKKKDEVAESKANKVGEMIKDGYNYLKQGVITGFNATKNFFAGMWEAIKGFFSRAGEFVKGLFDKEKLQGYAAYAMYGFVALLAATLAYMGGAYIVGMAGISGLLYVAGGGATLSLVVIKATQVAIDKAEEVEVKAKAAA